MGAKTETEFEFVTAPTTPEAAQPDVLEILVQQRLQHDGEGGSSSMATIFRVPADVRDAHRELYEPRLVSVGPYYRGRVALGAMEQHKWRYLGELLALYPASSQAACVGAVRGVEEKARRCYSERTDIFDAAAGDHFAEMLLLDGCFVLLFCIRWCRGEERKICDVDWGLPQLLSDLLLLENQIPFFVLEALFRALSGLSPEACRQSLLRLILCPYKLHDSCFIKELLSTTTQADEIHHMLHLFYKAFVPRAEPDEELASVSVPTTSPSPSPQLPQGDAQPGQMGRRMPWVPGCIKLSGAWFRIRAATMTDTGRSTTPAMVVPSVTLLRDAGVRFKKKASPRDMLDITFDRGVLSMPYVEIDYSNKPRLVNLVAFEQTCGRRGAAKPLTSYTALLSCLARTGRDVEHLQKRGIVDNLLSDHDDAARRFFQQLGDCSTLDYDNHLFAAIFRDLRQYYHSSWRSQKVRFIREHCSSPWAVVALVVAVCVFCFALFKFSATIYNIAHHKYCRHC
ncbi:hypothetical protein BS78_04G107700 [Paspalum vaginatum]|nr:hypothetical protein BS78_04G107700 [Paspalum vaginatum]